MSSTPSPTDAGCKPAGPAFYVVGPTGVGKSELAVQIAERIGGEIVGADAFQVYSGLPILTAQPSAELQTRVPHHLVGEIPLTESFNLAAYLRLAGERIATIRARGHVPIVAGGTGLYIRGLIHGLADLPGTDEALRQELEKSSLLEMNERLRGLDPVGAEMIDSKNPRRVIRALEVCLLTGKPFSSFREEWRTTPSDAAGILVLREKAELHARIDQRVVQMFAEGVVDEVRATRGLSATARQVLGLRQIERLLAGEVSREECINDIQRETRHYAKRQLTWFRREPWLKQIELSVPVGDSVDAIADEVRMLTLPS